MTIAEAISYGTAILKENEVIEPRRESALLLSLATQRDRAYLIAYPEKTLHPQDADTFRQFVARRATHEPFQYISGRQEFYGLDFEVTPDVLIPRPETETLVEEAIEELRDKDEPRFCEIGVGSGCISVAILHLVEHAQAVAADISEKALAVARRNAGKHGVADRLQLHISDVFYSLELQQFDLVVSNPPYVPSRDIDTLQPEVRDFEPHSSLTDGANGLSIIKRLADQSPRYLKPHAALIIEIGFNQGRDVAEMFDEAVWKSVEMMPDLQGIPRIVLARLK